MSWDFIQLKCSTCRKLTRADVHFEHELGLHPTLIAALAACSLEQLRFRLAEGSRPLVPDDMCKCHTQETRVVHFEQSWDFIQHSCSTYCMLTRAPEDPTQMSEVFFFLIAGCIGSLGYWQSLATRESKKQHQWYCIPKESQVPIHYDLRHHNLCMTERMVH